MKTTNESSKKVTPVKVVPVTHLKEGITGKMLTRSKIEGNRANKNELRSISFNLKQINKHGVELLKGLKVTKVQLTPANLLPLRTVKEVARMDKNGGLVTFWLIESLIIRYAKSLVK